jgi:hypothetical protein
MDVVISYIIGFLRLLSNVKDNKRMAKPKGGGKKAQENGDKGEKAMSSLIKSYGLPLIDGPGRSKKECNTTVPTYYRRLQRKYGKSGSKRIHDYYTIWKDRFGKDVKIIVENKEQHGPGSAVDKIDSYAFWINIKMYPFVIVVSNEGCSQWFGGKLKIYEEHNIPIYYFEESVWPVLIQTLESCRARGLSEEETMTELYNVRDNETCFIRRGCSINDA